MAPLIIDDVDIYQYRLPLHALYKERLGLIVKIVAGECLGFGEVAPLPGRSQENLQQALLQASDLRYKLKGLTPARALENIINNTTILPSISFGFFSALCHCIHGNKALSVKSCGLLYGSYKQMLKELNYIQDAGFEKVKIKTAKLTLDELVNILAALPVNIKIRLDANQSFDEQIAKALVDRFGIERFDYIEEPFKRRSLSNTFSLPIAADESFEGSISLRWDKIQALVFKPMIHGFGPQSRKILATAQKKGIPVILSSSLESGIGLYQIASLAHHLAMQQQWIGIDTYKLLKADVLKDPPQVNSGVISFTSPSLTMKHLTMLPLG
jgi:O-succinylbenzoate synthase